jgi:phage terminase large subunit-like protein
MQTSFSLTAKQQEAQNVLGSQATDILLKGGSRSGKTFLICRAIAIRALAAKKSRHGIFREHFNHVKTSIALDTWPKMMDLCFPDVKAPIDRTDWYAQFPNGSEVWFGGLDDKERVEKVLGKEFATLFLNEISQTSWHSRNIAKTRLAQKCTWTDESGNEHELRLKTFYDCNPPSKAHWAYKVFEEKKDPETGRKFDNPGRYASFLINPEDNKENLASEYLESLRNMSKRMRDRFLEGKYSEVAPGQLWTIETIDRYRVNELPEMQRIVVSVDPSGADDSEDSQSDAIGITVCGLGVDGNGYLLEDLTLRAGPATWSKVATTAYDRHQANTIIAEKNFGGEMVRHTIRTAKANVPCKLINASKGKVPRADPIASLHEQGKIKFSGQFNELEDELLAFTTTGYKGDKSPNRADAFIWGMSELFPGLVKPEKEEPKKQEPEYQEHYHSGAGGWMS